MMLLLQVAVAAAEIADVVATRSGTMHRAPKHTGIGCKFLQHTGCICRAQKVAEAVDWQ